MADSTYKYGGDLSNEQPNTSKGFSGKQPADYFADLSNEQPRTFKGFPKQKGTQAVYERGCSNDNENPKGWKQ